MKVMNVLVKGLKWLAITILVLVVATGLWAWIERAPSADARTAAVALPHDFIWGVSCSGFQSEGGRIDSNIMRWNETHASEDRYGNSVDFRHRYREDISLARAMGINTYRIGINWARVQPERGSFDERELAYYDDVILAMKQAGIAPLITLDHFVYPGWVADQDGWSNSQTVTDFVAFSRLIATRYHADVRYWLTFNEAAFNVSSEAAKRKTGLRGAEVVADHIVSAHNQVYDLIHALRPDAVVASNIVWMGDTFISRRFQSLTDRLFLDHIVAKDDVIALDYYGSDFIQIARAVNAWKWNPDPPGIYRALRILSRRFPNKPLLISETGMATENGHLRDGLRREDVLRDTVYWTQRARADGVNVIGYMVWSLTDNFEWGSYTPRFGLYTVDALRDPALKRVPTAAVDVYRAVIAAGGVDAEYRPVIQR
jgi:beta-glucosidase